MVEIPTQPSDFKRSRQKPAAQPQLSMAALLATTLIIGALLGANMIRRPVWEYQLYTEHGMTRVLPGARQGWPFSDRPTSRGLHGYFSLPLRMGVIVGNILFGITLVGFAIYAIERKSKVSVNIALAMVGTALLLTEWHGEQFVVVAEADMLGRVSEEAYFLTRSNDIKMTWSTGQDKICVLAGMEQKAIEVLVPLEEQYPGEFKLCTPTRLEFHALPE